MTDPIRMHHGAGVAHPITALYPAALDAAMGSEEARQEWEAANADGTKAQAAYLEACRAWAAANPTSNYPDPVIGGAGRPLYESAYAFGTRTERDAVTAATVRSKAALTAYHARQIAGARTSTTLEAFASAYLAADARAIEALAVIDAAIVEREELMKFLVTPEKSTTPGRGHFRHSTALGIGRMSLDAKAQRDDLRVVVMAAPRALVAARVSK